MPVETKNLEYQRNFNRWQKCRHIIAGQDDVKAAGEMYLPRIDGMTNADYADYLARAIFFNASGRTVDSFTGLIFRKDPVNDLDDSLADFEADITLQGESLYDYEKDLTREIISVGRCGSWIDWSEEQDRPFVVNYTAEQIINWQQKYIDGQTLVSMVVLHELISADDADDAAAGKQVTDQTENVSKLINANFQRVKNLYGTGSEMQTVENDEYNPKFISQIRVLKLVLVGIDWQYQVEVWQKKTFTKKSGASKKTTEAYELLNTLIPTRKGKPLNAIPFVFHGPNNMKPQIDKQPMLDIVNLNIGHYINSADYENILHYSGVPTLYAFGEGFGGKTIKLGTKTAVTSDDHLAKIGFIELTGKAEALVNGMEEKKEQMAVLGARMLEKESSRSETIQVMEMKQTGEQASLAQIAATCSIGMETVCRWALWWMSPADAKFNATSDAVKIELNSQFNPTDIDPSLALAVGSLRAQGVLSQESATYALKRGEIVSPNLSVEEEMELIQNEMKLQGQPIELKKDKAGAPGQEN